MHAFHILPYAHGGPVATGRIKQCCEDFVVEEVLGFNPSGVGEHIYLRIEKQGENTDFLARELAKFAGIPRQSVSYAGLKDRQGRTIQWFSIHLPGKREIDWTSIETETLRILETTRNDRKLKKGALRGNRFRIVVRELAGELSRLEERLKDVSEQGIPNYFGPQRFGREGQNLSAAIAMFKGEATPRDRYLRGIYLSSARAAIFNLLLSGRVSTGNWCKPIPGDVFMFGDSNSFFSSEITGDIERRITNLDIHPSGPLWGKGESPATLDALILERAAAVELHEFSFGLIESDIEMGRRSLRVPVTNLSWSKSGDQSLNLEFNLPAGSYATTVLREIVDFEGSLE